LVTLEFAEFLQEQVGAQLFGDAQVVAGKDRRGDRLRALYARGADDRRPWSAILPRSVEIGPGRVRRLHHRAVGEFTEDPRALAVSPGVVPDEPAGCERHRVRPGKVVARVSVLVRVVVGVCLVAPLVPEAALIPGGVVVVEHYELLRQRVKVRRDRPAEERQRGIAVALRQVAEHLIVGAVLLDDVDDVFDRRLLILARRHREHADRLDASRRLAAADRLVVRHHLLAVLVQLAVVLGHRDEPPLPGAVLISWAGRAGRRRRDRAEAVAVADDETVLGLRQRDGGREPADRNEAANLVAASVALRLDDGDGVVAGVRD